MVVHNRKDHQMTLDPDLLMPSSSARGKYFDVLEKHIDCDKMFRSDFIEGWRQDESAKHAPRLKFLVI